MITMETAPALSAEIKAALNELDTVRNRFRTDEIEDREWLERSIARVETGLRRVLHLIGA